MAFDFEDLSDAEEQHAAADADNAPAVWAKERLVQLHVELQELGYLPPSECRSRLRTLQLELHPDKQPPNFRVEAQSLFLLVQREWEAASQQCSTGGRGTKDTLEREGKARTYHARQARTKVQHVFEREWRKKEEEFVRQRLAKERKHHEQQLQQQQHRRAQQYDGWTRHQQESSMRQAGRRPKAKQANNVDIDPENWDDWEESHDGTGWFHRTSGEWWPAGINEEDGWDVDPEHVSGKLELEVVGPDGRLHIVKARSAWSVLDVKHSLEIYTRIPPSRQQLLHDGQELHDEQVVADVLTQTSHQLNLLRCKSLGANWFASSVKRNWRALENAPAEVCADFDVVLTAVKQDYRALWYASLDLRADRGMMHHAVMHDGRALEWAEPELRDDHELVHAAVCQNWSALGFASEKLRADKKMVLTAVQQNGAALQYASPDLRADKCFVLDVVKRDCQTFIHAAGDLASDREIVLTAVSQSGTLLKHAAPALRNDKEVALAAVRQSGMAMEFVSLELRQDRKFVLAAVHHNGAALRFVAPHLRADEEVALAATFWS